MQELTDHYQTSFTNLFILPLLFSGNGDGRKKPEEEDTKKQKDTDEDEEDMNEDQENIEEDLEDDEED